MDPNDKPNPDTPPPEDDDTDLMAAMDQGIEEATPETPAAPDEQDPPAPVEGEPEGGKPPGTENDKGQPPGAKPPEGEGDPAKKPEAAALEAGDAEITKGLKDKAKARFEELIGQVKELAPLREAMEKAGIKDVAELPKLVEKAASADGFIEMVTSTGASSDQFGMTLDYLAAVNAATKGDRVAGDRAVTMWLEEGKALHAGLGREMPGVYDALAEHADLQKAVSDGDITRERAVEVANARRTQAALQQQQTTQAQQAEQQAAQQQAAQRGVQSLAAWEADKLQDAKYLQLRPLLTAEVAKIRAAHPPEQWATLTDYAYQALVAKQTQQPAAPQPGPVRPSGPRPTMVPQFDDPAAALDFALKEGA